VVFLHLPCPNGPHLAARHGGAVVVTTPAIFALGFDGEWLMVNPLNPSKSQ